MTGKSINYVHKGMNCLTEMYSAIKAEVILDDDESTNKNSDLVTKLLSYEKVGFLGAE